MPITDHALYALAIGDPATFSGGWLRYLPDPDTHDPARYLEGYRGHLQACWNGSAEFTVDRDAARAIVSMLNSMAEVSGDWRTVAFDGEVLTVRAPWSLGSGVSLIRPLAGRYRIGWGLPWLPVDAAHCDRVVGRHAR